MDEIEYKTRQDHRSRVRDKIKNGNASKMSDIEILEAVLFGIIPRKDTNPLARKLIGKFGGIDKVFEAGYSQLKSVGGVGEIVATYLMLMTEVVERYRSAKHIGGRVISKWDDAISFLRPHLEFKKQEEFHVLYLDAGYKLLRYMQMEEGVENMVCVYNRKICRIALELGAVNVFIAHNHPSSDVSPSMNDDEMTNALYISLKTLDIKLIDHIIISKESVYSYYKNKRLQEIDNNSNNSQSAQNLAQKNDGFSY